MDKQDDITHPSGVRRRWVRRTALLSLVLLLAPVASRRPSFPPTAQTLDPAGVPRLTSQVLAVVSELRGLPARRPVEAALQSRKTLEKQLLDDFNRRTGMKEIDADAKALEILGLLPPNFDLRNFLVRLLVEQIAGYYRPKSRKLYLADWLPVESQRTVMAHELTHALQDQHFNLSRFDRPPSGQSDRDLAIQALIEGEATAVMLNYALKPQGMDILHLPVPLDSFMDELGKGDGDHSVVLRSAPAVIRESLLFPYSYGVLFVQKLLLESEGSWGRVTEAYRRLPQSTEQIMHPEKYLQHEAPLRVEVPALQHRLGSGWVWRLSDVTGEFGYFVALSEFVTVEAARRASEGWDGDQMIMIEQARTGARCLIHFTSWDSTGDAIEFFEVYAERTDRRLGVPSVRGDSSGLDALRSWRAPGGVTVLERRGQRVAAVESLPISLAPTLPILLTEIWKSRVTGL